MHAGLKKLATGLCLIALWCPVAWAQTQEDLAQHMAPTGSLRAVINLGNGQASVWTCDLTKAYVEINGDYRS